MSTAIFAMALWAMSHKSAKAEVRCVDFDSDGFYRQTNCGTPPDCNDAAFSMHPGGLETCDGFDNDCNGLPDDSAACDGVCDAPAKIGDEVALGNPLACGQSSADAVWSGERIGLTWERYGCGSVNFSGVDPFGTTLVPETLLDRAGEHPQHPAIAWTGSAYGIVWDDLRSDVYLSRLDPDGYPLGLPTKVTSRTTPETFPSQAQIAWSGSEFGIVWNDFRSGSLDLYFARLPEPNRSARNTRLTFAGTNPVDPVLIWTGASYALAWSDVRAGNPEIFLASLTPTGRKTLLDVRVTDDPGASVSPSLVWNGSGYGIAWTEDRDGNGEIYFAILDAAGTRVGSEVRITSDPAWSGSPSLVWNGVEYGLAWTDSMDGNPEVYFARIDAAGARIGEALRITEDASAAGQATLVWTGAEYGLVWSDTRGNPEGRVYFARIGCN